MPKNHCQFFDTEYRSQYVEKKQSKVPINRQEDCFSERIEESWQIDPCKASKITKIDDDARIRAHRLILDTLKSVYMADFTDPKSRKTDNETESEADHAGSELLAHVKHLFHNPHEEKVLAPPPTAKRVFGYMRPKLFHNQLSDYQDGYERTGGMIMTRNAELAETSRRRETLRNKKIVINNINDPCSPERLADMHFT